VFHHCPKVFGQCTKSAREKHHQTLAKLFTLTPDDHDPSHSIQVRDCPNEISLKEMKNLVRKW